MIYIEKGKANSLRLTVSEMSTSDAYTIEFTRGLEVKTLQVTDESLHRIRYSLFNFTEGTDVELDAGEGIYKVFNSDNILAEQGVYRVLATSTQTVTEIIRPTEVDEVITIKRY